MNILFKKNSIKLSRILSVVDKFVIKFVKLLNKAGIRYVIVSGYPALLFGRERITEDIDVLFDKKNIEKIKMFYKLIGKKYWVLNAKSLDTWLHLLNENSAIRIAKRDTISPNIEFKPTKNEFDKFSLSNATVVIINKVHTLRISPFELQIPYKLHLGSKKDFEDARFLYNLFGDKINKTKFSYFCEQLRVVKKTKYLREING